MQHNHTTLCCYKCGAKNQLLVKEWMNKETGEIIRKEFICSPCAELFKKDEESK
jgi:hypothetical protein